MKRSLLVGSVVAILGVAALSPAAFAAPSPKPKAPNVPGHGNWKRTAAAVGFAATPQAPAPIEQGITQHIHIDHLAPQLYAAAGVPGATERIYGKTRLEAGGQVLVTVTGSAAAAAARSAGGRVIAQYGGASTVLLAPAQLRALAATAGVDLVQPAHRAVMNADSEGVAKSGAAAWHASGVPGSDGAGMKIGIVDGGFGDLANQQTAHNLPNGSLGDPAITLSDHCATAPAMQSQHGTAVAEIVHQMAPKANLYLYCVDDNVGFAQAGDQAIAAGLDVVNSSLGFPGDGRGDGTGLNLPGWVSSALTVKKARQAGVLWVESSGNSAQDHWSGTLADTSPHDGIVDLFGSKGDADAFLMHPGSLGSVALTWDKWSGTQLHVTLHIDEYDVNNNFVGSGDVSSNPGAPNAPIRLTDVTNTSGTPSDDHLYVVSIRVPNGTPALRFDLSYLGDVSPSFRAFPTAPYWGGTAADGSPARAAANSVSEPASSPYAFAVGAVYQGDNTLEAYSSRGSTIDGRVKPDILGFDGTTSNLSDFSTGFYGTSAASPHVAGAAALVKAASIAAGTPMDASETQAFLEARATPNANPATNAAGRGLLNLGSTSNIAAPAGAGYTPLTAPVRVFDTRHSNFGTGTHTGPLLTNQQLAVDPTVKPVPAPAGPSGVPANATAVVVNLTGVSATGPTALSMFPTSYAGTSNLNLSNTDPLASVAAIVPMDVATHTFKIRNLGAATHALIDVVGYFSAAGTDGYASLTPQRILNTRSGLNVAQAKLAPGQVVDVPASVLASAGVPADAKSVIVNLTVVNQTGSGWFAVFPDAFSGTSNLNYTKYVRADLAIATLNGAGGFKLMNSSSFADAVIDIVGYLGGSSAPARYVAVPSPVRIGDTRYGNGGTYGVMPAGTTLTLDGAKLHGVPFNAAGIWVGVTALSNTPGYLSVLATGASPAGVSTLNFGPGRQVPNAAAPGLSGGQFSVYTSAPTHTIVDLFGYFR